MEKTREVILNCWKGDGCAQIEVVTRKMYSNSRVKIAELSSPITIDDGAGMRIVIHGDGKMRKKVAGYRKQADLEERIRAREEEKNENEI